MASQRYETLSGYIGLLGPRPQGSRYAALAATLGYPTEALWAIGTLATPSREPANDERTLIGRDRQQP